MPEVFSVNLQLSIANLKERTERVCWPSKTLSRGSYKSWRRSTAIQIDTIDDVAR